MIERRCGLSNSTIFITHRYQWPWTTPNLVFKVTPFFDTQYLTNGYRYGRMLL